MKRTEFRIIALPRMTKRLYFHTFKVVYVTNQTARVSSLVSGETFSVTGRPGVDLQQNVTKALGYYMEHSVKHKRWREKPPDDALHGIYQALSADEGLLRNWRLATEADVATMPLADLI